MAITLSAVGGENENSASEGKTTCAPSMGAGPLLSWQLRRDFHLGVLVWSNQVGEPPKRTSSCEAGKLDGQPDSDSTVGSGSGAILRTLRSREDQRLPASQAAGAAAPTPTVQPDVPEHPQALPAEAAISVWVTFYSCPPYCGDPSGPLPLGEGQAACDPAYMGRRFALNGSKYICNDTGNAVWGAHVDLFFWSEAEGWAYLAQYGTEGLLTWLD